GVKGKSFIERGVTPLEDRYIGNANIFDEKEKKLLLVNYLNGLENEKVTSPIYSSSLGYDPITQMQNIDIQTWLEGDILLKAD
ncbi:asparagine synthetase B, partial [Bacillus sp. SIMBA_069]